MAAPRHPASSSSGTSTVAPLASASSWRQPAEREPPPITSTRSTGVPFWMRSSPLRMPKLTPSMAARIRCWGVKLLAERPSREPRAEGRSGVRSPLRNGRKMRPSAPGSVASSAASMSLDGAAERLQRLRDDVGRVHGADQRQPSSGGGAEGRDVAGGVEYRRVVEGVDGGGGAEATG